jgi:hypothetical protein
MEKLCFGILCEIKTLLETFLHMPRAAHFCCLCDGASMPRAAPETLKCFAAAKIHLDVNLFI